MPLFKCSRMRVERCRLDTPLDLPYLHRSQKFCHVITWIFGMIYSVLVIRSHNRSILARKRNKDAIIFDTDTASIRVPASQTG